MNDSFARLWTAVRAVATTAAMMTVLVTAIAFVIETTVHDWYATGKVTLAEAMIATGFDQSARTEYWTADGRTVRRSRYGLTIGEAWVVRHRLLSMAADRALLGACTGLVVGFLWLRAPRRRGLLGRAGPVPWRGPSRCQGRTTPWGSRAEADPSPAGAGAAATGRGWHF